MSNKHIYHYVYLIVNYAGKYYIGKRSTYRLPEYDIGVKYFS